MRKELLIGLAGCVAAMLLGSGPAVAVAAKSCTPPKYPSSGYFDRITVTGVTCATGDRLSLAFYRCRTSSGRNLAGRCHAAVLGYTCSERRMSIVSQIQSRVTCRRRGATVVTVYEQQL